MDAHPLSALRREESELFTLREAAAYLHRKPATLYRWRWNQRNPIPCFDIAGRIFYRRADLEHFINDSIGKNAK